MDEKIAIARAQAGDREAFCSLIKDHERRIYSVCFRYMGNEYDAEDAAQDAILKIFVNIAGFRRDSAFSTWVYRVTVNTCLDILRKRRETVPLNDTERAGGMCEPEKTVVSAEFMAALSRAISALDENYKSIIILKEMEHKKYEEIAAILGLSEGTVKSRLFRAREKIKGILREKGLL